MRQENSLPLLQKMACRLFGAKPLSESMIICCSIRPQATHFNDFLLEIQMFSFNVIHLKMSSAK